MITRSARLPQTLYGEPKKNGRNVITMKDDLHPHFRLRKQCTSRMIGPGVV